MTYVLIPFVVPTVAAVAALVVWLIFVIRYHLTTRGAWRESAVGRNAMNSSLLIIALVGVVAATRIASSGGNPEPFVGQRYLATAVYLFAVFSGVQRIVLQYRAQRDERKQ